MKIQNKQDTRVSFIAIVNLPFFSSHSSSRASSPKDKSFRSFFPFRCCLFLVCNDCPPSVTAGVVLTCLEQRKNVHQSSSCQNMKRYMRPETKTLEQVSPWYNIIEGIPQNFDRLNDNIFQRPVVLTTLRIRHSQ